MTSFDLRITVYYFQVIIYFKSLLEKKLDDGIHVCDTIDIIESDKRGNNKIIIEKLLSY